MVGWEEVGDGLAPFDDDNIIRIGEVVGKVVGHEAGVGKTIKIVVNEVAFAVG